MDQAMFHGAVVLLAFVILFVFFATAWQGFVVDVVRQRAFEVRDAAFLWAHDHDRLNSEAYVDFREAVNVSIRYYEEMYLLKVLMMLMFRKQKGLSARQLEGCAFFDDSHLKSEFAKLVTVFTIGLVLRSALGMLLLMLTTPLIILALILEGGLKGRPKEIAYRVRNEVQTDLMLAG